MRLLVLATLALLTGCVSYTEAAGPAPVVIQPTPAPATGTVVVQPN